MNRRSCLASKTIPEWPAANEGEPFSVGYFIGEGIGSEIVPPALELLQVVCEKFDRQLELREGGLIGKPALEKSGRALTDEVIDFCTQIFSEGGAIICGPGGGRFVYELRARFDLFCKYTPIIPSPVLQDAGCFKQNHLEQLDILAVRENTGGIYFGESEIVKNKEGDEVVSCMFKYTSRQVRRILECAFAAAEHRKRKVCVTTKSGGIPEISALWKKYAEEISAAKNIEFSILEIDNAVYQLIANPRSFDVVVSSNMFGDIIADAGAVLLGSRGMSYSGNFGAGGKAVYQTAHGAAYDIAGTDKANPLGQVMSVAMMLRESMGMPEASDLIFRAVDFVLRQVFRTADIASPDCRVVGTKEMTELLIKAVKQEGKNNCASSPSDRPTN
jgi:3-isopropylmalate dehydrogenase